MLAVERRNLILEKLQEDKKVIVSELSQEFQVSEETIRRDLDKLDKDGLAVKSYGGAVLNENTSLDMPFNIRKKNNPAGKQKIAKIVETLIEDGDHIILDPSTTAVFIAKALKAKERLTVITNSIEVILELSDVSDWNIISSGALRYSLDSFTGAGITPAGGFTPAFLSPALYSAIRLLGDRPCGQEYSSHNPQELQKYVLTKGLASRKSRFAAARMNLCGSIGCPSACLGHKSVHIWH